MIRAILFARHWCHQSSKFELYACMIRRYCRSFIWHLLLLFLHFFFHRNYIYLQATIKQVSFATFLIFNFFCRFTVFICFVIVASFTINIRSICTRILLPVVAIKCVPVFFFAQFLIWLSLLLHLLNMKLAC